MQQLIIMLTRILSLYSRKRMDVNNNLANMTSKVKCDFCEKSFFGEFLSKHLRISHPGVESLKRKRVGMSKFNSWKMTISIKVIAKLHFPINK